MGKCSWNDNSNSRNSSRHINQRREDATRLWQTSQRSQNKSAENLCVRSTSCSFRECETRRKVRWNHQSQGENLLWPRPVKTRDERLFLSGNFRLVKLAVDLRQPDRTLRYFRPSKSVDRRILFSSETTVDIFSGFQVANCSVAGNSILIQPSIETPFSSRKTRLPALFPGTTRIGGKARTLPRMFVKLLSCLK